MPNESNNTQTQWLKRIAWLGFIWLASIFCLGIIALLLRLIMNASGLIS